MSSDATTSTDIGEFFRLLHTAGTIAEIRAPNCPDKPGGTFKATASAYCENAENAEKLTKAIDCKQPVGTYVTINPVAPALLARSANRIDFRAKNTTTDADISRRVNLLIDVDSVRPAGVSATEDEMQAALELTRRMADQLAGEGWPAPLFGMSGNGGYLFYRIDLPNDAEATDLCKRALVGLAERFDTEAATVDTSTYNAARIAKILGTTARKGSNFVGNESNPARPWRQSWFKPPAGELAAVSRELLEAVASLPEPAPAIVGAAPSSNGHRKGGAKSAINRCRKYIAKMPDAISGQGGHGAILAAAAECFRFGLSQADALELMQEFNATKTGGEMFGDRELEHKLADALKKVNEAGEFGMRLKQQAKQNGQSEGKKGQRGRKQPKIEYKPGGRVEIEVTTEENTINEAVARAIGSDPDLFGRGGSLAMIGSDGGKAVICAVPEALVRDRISACVQFYSLLEGSNGGCAKIPQHPPTWCVKAIDAWPNWSHLRQLTGIVTSPTIREDGSLLSNAGYDPVSELYYAPDACVPVVPDKPTHEDALAARDKLLDIVCDFPFRATAHRATWLAYVLTLLARFAFKGPAPLFAFDATVAGTGKGLLTHVTFSIVYGREADVFTNPTNEDETRKRITSLAINGTPAVLIDNIEGVFGSGTMNAALTATRWGDRLLGVNQDVTLPLRIIWALTANNLVLKPDTARRIAHIRIESKEEKPEEREVFKYPKLLQHVADHRAELLGAGLTILRAWYEAAKPEQHLPAWGSFEGWSGVIRQAVVWIGLPDPASTRDEFRAAADLESSAFSTLIHGLLDVDPEGNGLQSAEIAELAEKGGDTYKRLRSAVLELCSSKDGKLSPRSIGSKLAHLRGRIADGRCIDYHDQRGNQKAWYVREVESQKRVEA